MKPVNQRRKADYGVGQRQFCEVWQTSESPEEVAERTGMPKPIVIARAAAYRKAGVPLKMMKRRPKTALDVEGLTRFLKELEAIPHEPESVSPEAAEVIHDLLETRE